MDAPLVRTVRFRAMNTAIEASLALDGETADSAFEDIRSWFAYAENVFSRFRPDSELSLLNRSAGRPVSVSHTMWEALAWARHYREWTGGLFEPAILPRLLQSGYSDSFERLSGKKSAAPESGVSQPYVRKDWRLIESQRAVLLEEGAQLDLGGIVKGWAADRIARRLIGQGVPAGLVNAGGDLRVWGGSGYPAWEIEINDPRTSGGTLAVVSLSEGAVATSGVLGRRWETAEGVQHHLIDPRTGRPGESDVLQCTMIGRSAMEAEIAAKTVCLLGTADGLAWLQKKCPSSAAVLMTRHDGVRLFEGEASPAIAIWKGENGLD